MSSLNLSLDPNFPPKIAQILSQLKSRPELPPLVPKVEWSKKVKDELDSLSLDDLFEKRKVSSVDFAHAVKSGLYLWNDSLSESHRLSQKIESSTGSYWHGIMHRREPDYPNSKHWFRRVGGHPIFPEVYKFSMEIFNRASKKSEWSAEKAEYLKDKGEWDAFALVDWCQSAEDETSKRLLESVQLKEIEILFSYSYHHAV